MEYYPNTLKGIFEWLMNIYSLEDSDNNYCVIIVSIN